MTGAPKNLYSFLGVSVTASPKEIKAAYRRLSMQYHPDRNPGADGYTEVFVKLGDAYDVLSDTEKRKQYDLKGAAFFGLDERDFSATDIVEYRGDGHDAHAKSLVKSVNPSPSSFYIGMLLLLLLAVGFLISDKLSLSELTSWRINENTAPQLNNMLEAIKVKSLSELIEDIKSEGPSVSEINDGKGSSKKVTLSRDQNRFNELIVKCQNCSSDERSAEELGVMFYRGIGTKRNLFEAAKYILMAQNLRFKESREKYLVMIIQEYLTEIGYVDIQVDGSWGPKTQKAIKDVAVRNRCDLRENIVGASSGLSGWMRRLFKVGYRGKAKDFDVNGSEAFFYKLSVCS